MRNAPDLAQRPTGGRSLCDGNVLVLDDFLHSNDRHAVWKYICSSSYRGAHHTVFERVFRHYDGECLMGPNVTFERAAAAEPIGDGRRWGDCKVTPSAAQSDKEVNGLQTLFRSLLMHSAVEAFLTGTKGWQSVNMRPYIYPVSSGLGWHTDRGKEAAFIYYAHPEWRAQWGGELLVAPVSGSPRTRQGGGFQDFYDQFDDGLIAGKDIGTFVAPAPNRLVLLRGGVPHCIKRVDPAAGEAFRASIAGFFLAEKDTARLSV